MAVSLGAVCTFRSARLRDEGRIAALRIGPIMLSQKYEDALDQGVITYRVRDSMQEADAERGRCRAFRFARVRQFVGGEVSYVVLVAIRDHGPEDACLDFDERGVCVGYRSTGKLVEGVTVR